MVNMVASKFNPFIIILLLLLCAATLLFNGMFMTLPIRWSITEGMRVEVPLYYNDKIGEYYIKLSMGTPAQDLLLRMDTGSQVMWAPCTPDYKCTKCGGYNTFFIPSNSSSALPVQCMDPNCKYLCEVGRYIANGLRTYPDYELHYASGNTIGHLFTDPLSFPTGSGRIKKVGFTFGCSAASAGVAGGIAGFGRVNLALPSQLSALIRNKFTYCLNGQNNCSTLFLRDMEVTWYPRAPPRANFGICYNVSGVGNSNIQFPEFAFHFGGGSHMVLHQGNSFERVTSDTYCLAFLGAHVPKSVAILGNYQQKNFYILYDRERNRLGFTQQACQKFA